jgi:hypothetical protein
MVKSGRSMYFFEDLCFYGKDSNQVYSFEYEISKNLSKAITVRYFVDYSDWNFFCCADTIDISEYFRGYSNEFTDILIANCKVKLRKTYDKNDDLDTNKCGFFLSSRPTEFWCSQDEYLFLKIKKIAVKSPSNR